MLWLKETKGAQKSEARRRAYAGGPDWTSSDYIHEQTTDGVGWGLFGGGEVSGADSVSRMGIGARAYHGRVAECQRHLREGPGATANESDGGNPIQSCDLVESRDGRIEGVLWGGVVAASDECADALLRQVPATT